MKERKGNDAGKRKESTQMKKRKGNRWRKEKHTDEGKESTVPSAHPIAMMRPLGCQERTVTSLSWLIAELGISAPYMDWWGCNDRLKVGWAHDCYNTPRRKVSSCKTINSDTTACRCLFQLSNNDGGVLYEEQNAIKPRCSWIGSGETRDRDRPLCCKQLLQLDQYCSIPIV